MCVGEVQRTRRPCGLRPYAMPLTWGGHHGQTFARHAAPLSQLATHVPSVAPEQQPPLQDAVHRTTSRTAWFGTPSPRGSRLRCPVRGSRRSERHRERRTLDLAATPRSSRRRRAVRSWQVSSRTGRTSRSRPGRRPAHRSTRPPGRHRVQWWIRRAVGGPKRRAWHRRRRRPSRKRRRQCRRRRPRRRTSSGRTRWTRLRSRTAPPFERAERHPFATARQLQPRRAPSSPCAPRAC